MMHLVEKYPIIGHVDTVDGMIPVLDIPMMSDERWEELAKSQAVKNYIRENGQEPDSIEVALEWQREWISRILIL